MKHKSCPVEIKSVDDEVGTFEALVSAFNNVDLVGDRIVPGAFKRTLRDWRLKGDPIPIVLSHKWDDVMAHIGIADPNDVKETPEGLLVKGTLDLDNPVAMQTYRLMKRRSLTAFSFGYTVQDERTAKDGANELLDVDLVEAGPTLKGANPEAQLQAVKSALEAETKQDRTTKDEEPPAKSLADVRRRIQRSRIAIR